MNLAPLFQLPKGVRLRRIVLVPDAVVVEAKATAPGARRCPGCQTPSAHVHSSYTRTIADIPVGARHVIVRLHVRKFGCRNVQCLQRIFAERFPTYARPRARKTIRMQDHLHVLGLLAGGRGGEALAQVLGFQVSDCTILRRLCAQPEPCVPPVRTTLPSDVGGPTAPCLSTWNATA